MAIHIYLESPADRTFPSYSRGAESQVFLVTPIANCPALRRFGATTTVVVCML